MTDQYLEDRCWERDNTALLRNTASKPADAGDMLAGKHVFDALHVAPPLRAFEDARRYLAGREGGRPAQQDALVSLLDPGAHPQKTLLFVTGPTGAGKSHMVRWLHAQHSAQSDDVCIHIPRTDTNLVRVVQILIEELAEHGEGLKKLLENVGSVNVGEGSSVEFSLVAGLSDYARRVVEESRRFQMLSKTQAQKELDELRGVSTADPAKPSHVDVVQSAAEIERAERWEELIRVKPAQVALSTPGGPLEKMQSDDPDERKLDEADLEPLSQIKDRDLAESLHAFRNELANPAIRRWVLDNLITARGMDFAVQHAGASIKADALKRELQQALVAAGEAGRRVVFFFEDWGTVTGVRSGLLEVFTAMDPPHVAVIADTTDEVEALRENVADRSLAVYEIGDAVDQFAMDVTARALNAVRVGGRELKRVGDPAPNACIGCPFMDDCHQAFGSHQVDGLGHVGLFPLTVDVVHTALTSGRIRETPRSLLVDLIRPVLLDAEDMATTAYPSADLIRSVADPQLKITGPRLDELQSRFGAQSEWVARLLWLYRPQPALESISADLAQAFGLEMGMDAAPCQDCGKYRCDCRPTHVATQTDDEAAESPPVDSEPLPGMPPVARDALSFGDDTAMSRGSVLRSLMTRFATATLPVGDGIGTTKDLTSAGLLGNKLLGFEGRAEDYLIELRRSDAEVLASLAWADDLDGDTRPQDVGHRSRAATMSLLDQWGRELKAHLRNPDRAKALGQLLRALVVLRSLTVESIEIGHPYDFIDAGLDEPGQVLAVLAPSAPQHGRLMTQALRAQADMRKRFLAESALTQGDTGGAFGIDIDLLHDSLIAMEADGCVLPAADDTLRDSDAEFIGKVRGALEAERTGLRALCEEVASLEEPVVPEDVDAVIEAERNLRQALLDGAGVLHAGTSPLQRALKSLADSLAKLEGAPDFQGTWQPPDPDALQPLELHAAYLAASRFRAGLTPRSRVTRAAKEVLREVGGVLDTSRLEAAESSYVDELTRFCEALGVAWGSGLSGQDAGELAPSDGGRDVVSQLQRAVEAASSAARAEQIARDLELAASKLDKALGRMADADTHAAVLKALGDEVDSLPSPPSPSADATTVEHVLSEAYGHWQERLEAATERRASAARQRWEEFVRNIAIPDLRPLLENVGDAEGAATFGTALRAVESARQGPPRRGAEKAVERLERLTAAAREAMEAHMGPAFVLARRILDEGGSVALTEVDFEQVEAALHDGTVSFRLALD